MINKLDNIGMNQEPSTGSTDDIDELVMTRQAGLFYGGALETLASGWTIGSLHNEYKSTAARKHFITPTLTQGLDKIREGKNFLCQNYCAAQKACLPISLDIFGFSQGAILANEVAHHLDAFGCDCDGVLHIPVKIRFLGLIDPVARLIPLGTVQFGFFKPGNVGAGVQELRSLVTDTASDANLYPQVVIAGLPEVKWSKQGPPGPSGMPGPIYGYAHGETGNIGGYPQLAGAVKEHLKQTAFQVGVQWK